MEFLTLNAFSFFKLSNLGGLVTQTDLQSVDTDTFLLFSRESKSMLLCLDFVLLCAPFLQQYKVILLVAALLNPRTIKITE